MFEQRKEIKKESFKPQKESEINRKEIPSDNPEKLNSPYKQ